MLNDVAALPYESTATISEVARRMHEAKQVAVFTHSRVDGDALGSMLAIKRSLEPMGKQVDIFVMGPTEPNLLSITGSTPYKRVEEQPPTDKYDLVIVVDTGAWTQLKPVEAWLKRQHDRILIIDHHSRGDSDVGPMRLIDPSKASTTHLLLDVLDELGATLTGGDGGVAEALFIGLATDTGWFRHSSAQAETFAAAARLLECGVDKSKLYQIIEETQRPERLALESRALASLQYARKGTVAIMSLGLNDFKDTNTTLDDLTGLVNAPLTVGDVRVSILIAQTEPGVTKISFRSKPPLPGSEVGSANGDFVDVNMLAHRFGGGGHVHAAGARVEADIDNVRETVVREVESM